MDLPVMCVGMEWQLEFSCYLLSLAYLTPKIFYLKLELLFIMIYKDFCGVFLGLYDDFATKDVQKWILPKGDHYYNIW